VNLEEFHVESNDEEVKVTLASPEGEKITDQSGLLINISATAQHAIHDETQNHPTPIFLDAGHYVVSFDLPCHGDRIDEFGEGILGMGAAYAAGVDKFEQFVADGIATVNACHERGIGNGRIVSYGVSRAGYCLLRLAAADRRIRAVAGCSPVTDWGIPEEMIRSRAETSSLKIDHWVDQLANTAVYLSVGSQDDVVGTAACVRFATRLFEKQHQISAEDTLRGELHVVNSPGHSPSRESRLDATRFLIDSVARP
tara:strand:- start:4368 stop:5132 length:765 start_codon:yes stop_codon:yes gene_type:complete